MARDKVIPTLSTGEIYERKLAEWLTLGLKKQGKMRVALAKLLGGINPSEISKMCKNDRKILAKHLFTIATYIEEPIPFPDGWLPNASFGAIPIIGTAGDPMWLDREPTPTCSLTLPAPPQYQFSHLPHFATKIVGETINRLILENGYAVYVPYFEARPTLTSGDLVLIKHSIPHHGIHKRLVLQAHKTNGHFVLSGASFTPNGSGDPVHLAADMKSVAKIGDTIDIIGLVTWQCGPIKVA